MSTTLLNWEDLEAIVEVTVANQYNKLATDKDRRQFCVDIASAEHLNRPKDGNVQYGHTHLGWSYALKYHLQRTDNICVALDYLYRNHGKPQPMPVMRVLDIGSGTGSGAMATGYWASKKFDVLPEKIEIICIEPSSSMRDAGEKMLADFYGCLGYACLHQTDVVPFSYKYSNNFKTLAACATLVGKLSDDEKFDLILFSYTFDIQTQGSNGWVASRNNVVKVADLLRPGGIVVFLTPNFCKSYFCYEFQKAFCSGCWDTSCRSTQSEAAAIVH